MLQEKGILMYAFKYRSHLSCVLCPLFCAFLCMKTMLLQLSVSQQSKAMSETSSSAQIYMPFDIFSSDNKCLLFCLSPFNSLPNQMIDFFSPLFSPLPGIFFNTHTEYESNLLFVSFFMHSVISSASCMKSLPF